MASDDAVEFRQLSDLEEAIKETAALDEIQKEIKTKSDYDNGLSASKAAGKVASWMTASGDIWVAEKGNVYAKYPWPPPGVDDPGGKP